MLGASASESVARPYSMSGGIVIGGSATESTESGNELIAAMSGGYVFGGTATLSRVVDVRGSGGLVVSGNPAIVVLSHRLMSGGSAIGGSAQVSTFINNSGCWNSPTHVVSVSVCQNQPGRVNSVSSCWNSPYKH